MNLKKLHIHVEFRLDGVEGEGLNLDDPSLKSMKEAARQLGLTFNSQA